MVKDFEKLLSDQEFYDAAAQAVIDPQKVIYDSMLPVPMAEAYETFSAINQELFAGRLRMVIIRISDLGPNAMGSFAVDRIGGLQAPVINVSPLVWGLTGNQNILNGVMSHECIHMRAWVSGTHDRGNVHGKSFRRICRHVNSIKGWPSITGFEAKRWPFSFMEADHVFARDYARFLMAFTEHYAARKRAELERACKPSVAVRGLAAALEDRLGADVEGLALVAELLNQFKKEKKCFLSQDRSCR